MLGILIQSSVSNAAQGIFFNYSTALKLGTERDYLLKTNENKTKQILEYKGIVTNFETTSRLKDVKIEGLTKDYNIQEQRANSLQDVYTQCNRDLIKEKEDKPSRFTWFGVGFITAVIAGLAAAFAIK